MTMYNFISRRLTVTIGKVDPISIAGLHITQSADTLTNVDAKIRTVEEICSAGS